jgi:tryptophan-rich sensory protein
MEETQTYPSTKPLYQGIQFIWYILAVLEILLAIRFFLKLLEANPVAGFTSFIYTTTEIFAAPFTRVFGSANIDGAVVEWGTLLAMVVYWIIASLVIRFLAGSRHVTEREAASELRDEVR